MEISPKLALLIIAIIILCGFVAYKYDEPVVKHEENFRYAWGRRGWGRPRFWNRSVYMGPYWL